MNIAALDTAFTAAKDASFNYASQPMWEFNQQDDPDKPVVFFALPFEFSEMETQFIPREKVSVDLYFLKYVAMTDTRTNKKAVVDDMISAMYDFMENLKDDTTLKPDNIRLIKATDIYEFLDPNYCGIYCLLQFECNKVC